MKLGAANAGNGRSWSSHISRMQAFKSILKALEKQGRRKKSRLEGDVFWG